MAKSVSGKGSGPARIRFVMLDAEAPDGDLSQITLAVQNALRSSDGAGGARRLITTVSSKSTPTADGVEGTVEEVAEEPVEETSAPQATRAGSARASQPRKGKMPTVLDLDLTSGVSFDDFARPKNPASNQKRHLVVAAWFKEHRNQDTITVDHVYTCYRSIGWPCNIPDFAQPLRELKHDQLLELRGKGLYAINHLGLAKVDKLKGE
ncbi:MAG TPA: hypothetical protein VFZ16_12850 [Hyphomicrobiaceae bacterium]|nr:hypothetical protein [Hyphomicrobiaceae bacterium]